MIQFDGHTATVCSLAFSPDSMTLASGAKDGVARLWDAAGVLVREVGCELFRPRTALAWVPSGDRLILSDGPELSRLRPTDTTPDQLWYSSITGGVSAIAPVTNTIVGIGTRTPDIVGTGALALFDLAKNATLRIHPSISGAHGISAVTSHQPTKRLHWVAGLRNSSGWVWRSWVITSPNATEVKLGKAASAITVSPDGGTVAIASDWIARVFTSDGKPKLDLTGHKGQVAGVGFIHGGRTVVSASWDETVRFWDVATGQETARFPLKVGKLTALAVSPDGTRVAVGGTDGPIVLIDAE